MSTINVRVTSNDKIKLASGYTFYYSGGFVSKGSVRKFLTLTEYRIINYFINNSDQTTTPGELIDHLSQYKDHCYSMQNIYGYIYNIRKKIETNPRNPEALLNVKPGYKLIISY
ncbi:helix-turn-helix domain-containing protein [Paenibacillus sp. NPDC056579]|uniref:winged helix-turn-helix domain-containing protein n=1 Tax=Paenibacillus sp. NPDC056579 TaxID=3345871 RepID=UPI003691C944